MLKGLRLALGLNQTEIARLFGRAQNTYARWETGENTPPPGVEEMMENIFAQFMRDVHAIRNGLEPSGAPWREVAEFWALQPELQV